MVDFIATPDRIHQILDEDTIYFLVGDGIRDLNSNPNIQQAMVWVFQRVQVIIQAWEFSHQAVDLELAFRVANETFRSQYEDLMNMYQSLKIPFREP